MHPIASRFLLAGLVASLAAAALTGCGGDGAGPRRTVQVIQDDTACTPATLEATVNEKLHFEVRNEGKKDAEIEGIEGTKLEELLIPSGKTRSIDYTAPGKPGVQKLKCYVPSGQSTIIQLNVKDSE